jgi:hypothetical protein
MNNRTKYALLVVVSWIAGFLLMIPLDLIFNAMHWPIFNGWALAHGSFIIAWPLLTLAVWCAIHRSKNLEISK